MRPGPSWGSVAVAGGNESDAVVDLLPMVLDHTKGPALYDPIEGADDTHWMPANAATEKLVACIEACKDITRCHRMFTDGVAEDRRALGILAVHVIGLADVLVGLRSSLGQEDRSEWPEDAKRNVLTWGKEVARFATGPLRKFRHQRGAHYEPDAITDRAVPVATYELVLPVLASSLALVLLYTNHEGVFAWVRRPPAAHENVAQLYQGGGLAPRFQLDANGSPTVLEGLTTTPDPRHRVRGLVEAAIEVHNDLAGRSGKHPLVFPNG